VLVTESARGRFKRHLSTGEAIRLIEEFGVQTPDVLVKATGSYHVLRSI
jgi:hypothetical protein